MTGITIGDTSEFEQTNETEETVTVAAPEVEVDVCDMVSYKGMVVNFENCLAVIVDKIFDKQRMLYKLGATAVVSFEKEMAYETRCPGLTLASIDELTSYLDKHSSELLNKVIIIKSLDELPFESKLIYENEEVYSKAQANQKLIVTFLDGDIDKVYAYKFKSKFSVEKAFASCKNIIDGKKHEMLMNNMVNNFMMVLGGMGGNGPKKTPGGIITP